MIKINTNKGIVKIESWDDIESRPGFVKNLDLKKAKLDAIIGSYIFPNKINCGLSNCHTPHFKGYIISTTEGQETNIGKDCGKTYFSVDFESLSRKFDRDVTESDNREVLWSFKFKLDDIEKIIVDIRKSVKGADWANRKIKPLLVPFSGCPSQVVSSLKDMVKTGNTILSISRKVTEKEKEEMKAMQITDKSKNENQISTQSYIDEAIAEIDGVEALHPENNLRDLLIKGLEINISEFKGKDINLMSYQELKHWVKWAGSVDGIIDKSKFSVSCAQKLLKTKNLEPFMKILTDEKDKKLFKQYLKSILVKELSSA